MKNYPNLDHLISEAEDWEKSKIEYENFSLEIGADGVNPLLRSIIEVESFFKAEPYGKKTALGNEALHIIVNFWNLLDKQKYNHDFFEFHQSLALTLEVLKLSCLYSEINYNTLENLDNFELMHLHEITTIRLQKIKSRLNDETAWKNMQE